MIGLPKIENMGESFDSINVYQTRASINTSKKEIEPSSLNLSIVPTNAEAIKSASTKRSNKDHE